MRVRLDGLDGRILEQLQDDGRKPFTKIAGELGVSEATVRQRVARMVHRHIVKFVADVDPLELGLIMAYVGVTVRGASLKRAVEALAKIAEIDYIVMCAGSFDVLLEIVCKDHEDLLRILQDGVRAAPGIEGIETFTTLRVAKDTYRWSELLLDDGVSAPTPRRSQA